MYDTADTVQEMAAGANIVFTPDETAQVTAIVAGIGSFAPEAEVVALFQQGALSPNMLAFFLPWMWVSRPDGSPVPTETWWAMFQATPYTEEKRVTRSRGWSVRAYRGAIKANRYGLSWSLDVGQARYFAAYRQAPRVHDARVWVTNIPAEWIFARFVQGWEKEVTADVRGLAVYPVEEERRLPRFPWLRDLLPR